MNFIFYIVLFTSFAYAQTSGTCGDSCSWSYSGTTLTISGSGIMNDYSYSDRPWYDFKSSITTVIIEEGITTIGESAFFDCTSLTRIYVDLDNTN